MKPYLREKYSKVSRAMGSDILACDECGQSHYTKLRRGYAMGRRGSFTANDEPTNPTSRKPRRPGGKN